MGSTKGGIRLQDMVMDREFKQPNTVKGVNNKVATLTRLGLKPEVVKAAPKYVIVNGVPNKVVNGKLVPMTAQGTRVKK